MCDMVLGHTNEFYIISFVNYVGPSINTKNGSYELEFLIFRYFRNNFLRKDLLMTMVHQIQSKNIGMKYPVTTWCNIVNIPSAGK